MSVLGEVADLHSFALCEERMPRILVRRCDIRQPISKQYLQSSVGKCERQLNYQQHTDTERSCVEEEERGIVFQ